MYEAALIDLITDIKQELELLWGHDETDNLVFGEMIAYTEVLNIIQDFFCGQDEVLQKLGLDMDIEQTYLIKAPEPGEDTGGEE